MFKRMAAALLSLMLLLSTAAASGETLYVQPGNLKGKEAFLAKHPEVTVELVTDDHHNVSNMSTSELYARILTGEFNCDAYRLSTSHHDVKAIMNKGYLMDLSSSQVIADAVNRMWPSIRDQVTADGKIYGVPSNVNSNILMCQIREFQEAGYDEHDVPHSFAELLDFLDGWIIRNEEEPQSFQVFSDWNYEEYDRYSYIQRLVEMLIDQYVMQRQYAGEPMRFDDPALVEYLERCVVIGAKLGKIEAYDDAKYMPLFGNFQSWGNVDTWSVATSVQEGQPRLIKVNLDIDVVNAGTPCPELAVEYLEDSVLHPDHYFTAFSVYMDAEPIKNEFYEETLRWHSAQVAMATDQLNGGLKDIDSYVDMSLLSAESQEDMRSLYQQIQDEGPADLREDLALWQRYLDKMPSREYDLSPEQIADYAKFAPTLFFPAPSVFSGSDEGRSTLYELERRFATGQINAQQLCGELNRIAEMMEMEAR